MRLACHLRELRGDRSLRDLEETSGISRATLSQIERGVLLPLDKQVEAIEAAYGVERAKWYPDFVWAALALGHDEERAA